MEALDRPQRPQAGQRPPFPRVLPGYGGVHGNHDKSDSVMEGGTEERKHKEEEERSEHPELGQACLGAKSDAVLMEYTQARVKIIEVTPATEKQFYKNIVLVFLKLMREINI